jgi:hypothetical protein
MSNWDRSSGTEEEAGGGVVSRGGLEELRPAQPDRVLPRWLGPLLGLVIGAVLVMLVGGLTDVFDGDPTEAEVTALFDQGFAAGASQARDEAEALRRESAAFARGQAAGLARAVVEAEALIREAEGLATRAAGASALVLAAVERDQGLQVGFRRGFQDGFEAGFEDGYEAASAGLGGRT